MIRRTLQKGKLGKKMEKESRNLLYGITAHLISVITTMISHFPSNERDTLCNCCNETTPFFLVITFFLSKVYLCQDMYKAL